MHVTKETHDVDCTCGDCLLSRFSSLEQRVEDVMELVCSTRQEIREADHERRLADVEAAIRTLKGFEKPREGEWRIPFRERPDVDLEKAKEWIEKDITSTEGMGSMSITHAAFREIVCDECGEKSYSGNVHKDGCKNIGSVREYPKLRKTDPGDAHEGYCNAENNSTCAFTCSCPCHPKGETKMEGEFCVYYCRECLKETKAQVQHNVGCSLRPKGESGEGKV